MIDELFILREDGICLFHLKLNEDRDDISVNSDLFAGFTSAIIAFTMQIGAGELSKIEFKDELFVFQKLDRLITVARIGAEDDVVTARHVVSLVLREFIEIFEEPLKSFEKNAVRRDIFFSFKERAMVINSKCEKVAKNNPKLLENIPPSIEIEAIEELSDFSDELLEEFPETTIRLTRKFKEKLSDDVRHIAMFKLGKELGRDLMFHRYNGKISKKRVNRLLQEISICSFNNDKVTLKICPFCRGRHTKEFDCDFVSGFIEGAFNDSSLTVREISCHAVGDKNCVFKLIRE
jgi:predicted hydrocarbon binding protein